MISPVCEASSWALAAELARRVGAGYRLLQAHIGGGQTDVLWFLADDENLPDIRLNRLGGISIANGEIVLSDHLWCQRIATGEVGIKALANQIVERLPVDRAGPSLDAAAVAAIAAVMRDAAMCGQVWRCLHGYLDHPHGSEPRAKLFAPYAHVLAEPVPRGSTELADRASRYWFVLDGGENPVACFDMARSRVLRPGEPAVTLPSDSLAASELATSILAPTLRQAIQADPPVRPGLGLPSVLAKFNRKERFYLLGAACDVLDQAELHSPSLRLSNTLRRDLHKLLGWNVPEHAWMAMDYHLNWLHAALQWHNGATHPGQAPPLPLLVDHSAGATASLITGTQEDCDLIIAWTTAHGPRIVLIEAKAYGSWDNAQAKRKVERVNAMLAAQTDSNLELRLVFASPRAPQKLNVAGWPSWAVTREPTPDIHPPAAWMSLPVPGGRLNVERTDERGKRNAAGQRWHITGP